MGVLILNFPTGYGCQTRNKLQQLLLRRNATATQIGSLAADTEGKKTSGRQTNACIEPLLKLGGKIQDGLHKRWPHLDMGAKFR